MIRLKTNENGCNIFVNPFIIKAVGPRADAQGKLYCLVYGVMPEEYPLMVYEDADAVRDKIEEAIRAGGTVET